MTNEQFEIIMEAKRIMEQNGIKGVQYMSFDGEIAVFEAFGKSSDDYVNYTVNVTEAMENEEIEFKKTSVLVEEYEEDGEIDVTVNITTYDDSMKQINFEDETVKTYKRMKAAVKKGKEIAGEITGSNFEILYL